MASHGNDEEIMKILKDVYRSEAASPDFKVKLRNRIAAEASGAPRPLWRRPRIWIPAAAGIAVALVLMVTLLVVPAITPNESVSVGTLQVLVTHAKKDPVVTAINVTFDRITVHRAGDQDSGGEWIVIAENLGRTLDMLQLSGVEELLGQEEIQTGHYTQIRIGVVSVAVTVDGLTEEVSLEPVGDVEMPSGELKFVRPFEVKADETTTITIDFDISADKSVVLAGSKWIFKPTIKLAITSPGE